GRRPATALGHVAHPAVHRPAQQFRIWLAAVRGEHCGGDGGDRVGDRTALTAANPGPAALNVVRRVLVPASVVALPRLADRQASLYIERFTLAGRRPEFRQSALCVCLGRERPVELAP